MPARIAQEDADLAVPDPALQPRALTRHAGRLRSFLQEPSLVQNQYGIGIAELLDHVGLQVVPHRVSVPPRGRQELLHTIRRAVAGRFGQLPAVLTLDRRQQATKVGRSPAARLGPPKTGCDAIHDLVQTRQPVGHISARRRGREPSRPTTRKPDCGTRAIPFRP